jgi:hypothetical protein
MGRGGRSWQDLCYTPIQALLRAFGAELPAGSFAVPPPPPPPPAKAAFVLLRRPAQAAQEPSVERPPYARTASYATSGG